MILDLIFGDVGCYDFVQGIEIDACYGGFSRQ